MLSLLWHESPFFLPTQATIHSHLFVCCAERMRGCAVGERKGRYETDERLQQQQQQMHGHNLQSCYIDAHTHSTIISVRWMEYGLLYMYVHVWVWMVFSGAFWNSSSSVIPPFQFSWADCLFVSLVRSREQAHAHSFAVHSPTMLHTYTYILFSFYNSIAMHMFACCCFNFYGVFFLSFFVCLLSMPSTSNTLCIVTTVILPIINIMIANQARVIFRWDTLSR